MKVLARHSRTGANAHLDYLYKWYLWSWAFRDLTKDRPHHHDPG